MPDAEPRYVAVDGKLVPFVPDPALGELGAAVTRFELRHDASRPPAFVAEDLRQLQRLRDRIALEFAKRAARFAASNEWDRQGSLSPATWIRHECKMTGSDALAAVRAGEQLPALPESAAAMSDGHIGYAHLTQMASLAADIAESPERDSSEAFQFDENAMLEKALVHSVSRFRHDVAHARHAADAKGFLAEQLTAIELRSFEILPCKGGATLRGRLDPVGTATLLTALGPLARRCGPSDSRSRKRRMADALVELPNHVLDAGTLPSQGGQRPHLQVTCTLETLQGRDGAPAGELEFSQPIHATTVERLACDAGITRIVRDAESMIIDVGRKRRVPTAPARRALAVRDGGCVWPGCERPPSWTNAHHLRHWTRDHGHTDVSNMALVCLRHHTLLHEHGWQLAKGDDGRWLTVPPLASWPRPHVVAFTRDVDEEPELPSPGDPQAPAAALSERADGNAEALSVAQAAETPEPLMPRDAVTAAVTRRSWERRPESVRREAASPAEPRKPDRWRPLRR